jgi:hypothetical protein
MLKRKNNFRFLTWARVVKQTVVFFTPLFGITVVTPHLPRGEIEKTEPRSDELSNIGALAYLHITGLAECRERSFTVPEDGVLRAAAGQSGRRGHGGNR